MVKATPASSDDEHVEAIFEQYPFNGAGAGSAATIERKLYVFDMIRAFEARGVTTVVLPCFLSHTFIDELKANTRLPIVDIVEAVLSHVQRKYPDATRIGVLASDYVREKRLFDAYFPSPPFDIVYPRSYDGVDLVTEAVYGVDGIKRGNLGAVRSSCCAALARTRLDQGVQVIVPG